MASHSHRLPPTMHDELRLAFHAYRRGFAVGIAMLMIVAGRLVWQLQ
tara:strand:- start:130 stop:270 length:141 start_codon:yes stop_codon:yes gene_type:complete